jgi:hypothetical protein
VVGVLELLGQGKLLGGLLEDDFEIMQLERCDKALGVEIWGLLAGPQPLQIVEDRVETRMCFQVLPKLCVAHLFVLLSFELFDIVDAGRQAFVMGNRVRLGVVI